MPPPNPNLIAKLDAMAAEFAAIELQLTDPDVLADHQRIRQLSIKRSALADLVERYHAYQSLGRQIEEDRRIIATEQDRELVEMANQELPQLERDAAAELERIANE